MIKKWFFAIHLLVIAFMTHPVPADETRTLSIVRGDGFWPPYEWVDNGVLKGFHIDLVREVAAALGLRVEIESYPWLRALMMIREGRADAISYLAWAEEREQFACYVKENQLHTARVGFLAFKNREAPVDYSGDLEQLKDQMICTLFGQIYGKAFEEATYLKREDVKTEELVLKKLKAGRCKVGVGYIDDYRAAAIKLGFDKDIEYFTPYLSEHPVYLAFSKLRKHEGLARRFAKGMASFKNTPRYRELLKKYNIPQ